MTVGDPECRGIGNPGPSGSGYVHDPLRFGNRLAAEDAARPQQESVKNPRVRHLLDDNVSLEGAWSEIHSSKSRAAASTLEALVYSLRAGGTALDCPHARTRLAELSEAQLHEVSARLQRFKPHIARAWTPIEVEMLVAIWFDLHG